MATSCLEPFPSKIDILRPSLLARLGSVVQSRAFACSIAATLLGYAVFLGANFSSCFSGSDWSGYANSAKLLTEGKLTMPVLVAEGVQTAFWHYTPLGFCPRGETGIMAPTYPVGLPALMAVATTIAGWHWGTLLLYVCGTLATLLCCYGSCRELGVARVWALSATAMFAISPMLLWSATQLMSDGVAATWNAAAFYAALRGRRSLQAATWCGVLFAIAVCVRPTNCVLAPALFVVLRDPKRLAVAALGGAPLAVVLGCYNTLLWELPWRTGYGNHHELFASINFLPTLAYYAKWIPHLLPIGALGLVCFPFLRWRTQGRELLGVVLWAIAFVGGYAFYKFTRTDWWWSRFILPGYPALAILGALTLDRLAAITNRRGQPLIAAVTATVIGVTSIGLSAYDWRALGLRGIKSEFDDHAALACWIDEHVPAKSIICTQHFSGAMVYLGRTILRWNMLNPETWHPIVEQARAAGYQIYFTDIPSNVDAALHQQIPGNWVKLDREFHGVGVWRLSFD